MPRINQKTEDYAREDFLRDVRQCQGRCDLMNCKALSDASGIPYMTLIRRLQNPEDLTVSELRKLKKAIGLDPFAILDFLLYNQKEISKYINTRAGNCF